MTSLEIRREAVFRCSAPLLAALCKADVASRSKDWANSGFLSATAAFTFLVTVLVLCRMALLR